MHVFVLEMAKIAEAFSYTTFPVKSGLHGVIHRPFDYQESSIEGRE
jgi:hypothetical protein